MGRDVLVIDGSLGAAVVGWPMGGGLDAIVAPTQVPGIVLGRG